MFLKKHVNNMKNQDNKTNIKQNVMKEYMIADTTEKLHFEIDVREC